MENSEIQSPSLMMRNLPIQFPPVERNRVTQGSEVPSSDGVSPAWSICLGPLCFHSR
jgi:hypothetical protein